MVRWLKPCRWFPEKRICQEVVSRVKREAVKGVKPIVPDKSLVL